MYYCMGLLSKGLFLQTAAQNSHIFSWFSRNWKVNWILTRWLTICTLFVVFAFVGWHGGYCPVGYCLHLGILCLNDSLCHLLLLLCFRYFLCIICTLAIVLVSFACVCFYPCSCCFLQ